MQIDVKENPRSQSNPLICKTYTAYSAIVESQQRLVSQLQDVVLFQSLALLLR